MSDEDLEEISVVRVQAMEDKAVLCCVVVENLEDDLTNKYPDLLSNTSS